MAGLFFNGFAFFVVDQPAYPYLSYFVVEIIHDLLLKFRTQGSAFKFAGFGGETGTELFQAGRVRIGLLHQRILEVVHAGGGEFALLFHGETDEFEALDDILAANGGFLQTGDESFVVGTGGLEQFPKHAILGFAFVGAGVHAEADLAGFGPAGAAESPGGGDDLIHEHFFERADGGEVLIIFAAEFFEGAGAFVEVLAFYENGFGQGAVLEGVHPGNGLAGRGTGARGLLGVLLVGGDLFFRGHKF